MFFYIVLMQNLLTILSNLFFIGWSIITYIGNDVYILKICIIKCFYYLTKIYGFVLLWVSFLKFSKWNGLATTTKTLIPSWKLKQSCVKNGLGWIIHTLLAVKKKTNRTELNQTKPNQSLLSKSSVYDFTNPNQPNKPKPIQTELNRTE